MEEKEGKIGGVGARTVEKDKILLILESKFGKK